MAMRRSRNDCVWRTPVQVVVGSHQVNLIIINNATGHRLQTFSNGTNFPGSLNSEVTNENIIGWEIIVTGIPVEWTEPDLLVG